MEYEIEYWRTIPSFPAYSASNLGRIRNEKTGRIMHVYKNQRGYLHLTLRRNGEQICQRVHRLVAETFLGGEHPDFQVNHIDGDKTNNCIENLEWCTPGDNTRHAVANGLRPGPRRKAVMIVETGEIFESLRACAEYLGVDISSVRWAINNNGRCRGCHFKLL